MFFLKVMDYGVKLPNDSFYVELMQSYCQSCFVILIAFVDKERLNFFRYSKQL